MKKRTAKSAKIYDQPFELDAEKIVAAMRRYKNAKKRPTSVALDEVTVRKLKKLAGNRGIPYQVFLRALILEGLSKFKDIA